MTGQTGQIGGRAALVQVTPVGVQDNGEGEVLHLQTAHRLTAQVLPADDLQLLHAGGHQGPGTTQGGQVDRPIADHRILHGLVPLALSDHDELAQVQQAGGVGVHPAAGGGTGGADDLTGALRSGAHIVDGGALHGEGQGTPGVQQLHHPLVGGIPGGVDGPRQEHGVTGPQGGEVLSCNGGSEFILHGNPSQMAWSIF